MSKKEMILHGDDGSIQGVAFLNVDGELVTHWIEDDAHWVAVPLDDEFTEENVDNAAREGQTVVYDGVTYEVYSDGEYIRITTKSDDDFWIESDWEGDIEDEDALSMIRESLGE